MTIGIAISAVQPSLVRRAAADQTPFQSRLMFDADPARVAAAFFEDLLLELRAQRVGHEHVARTRVAERVEDDLEVVFVEHARRVAPHFGGDDAVGIGVEGVHARCRGAFASYSTRTSVRSVAGSPSDGSCCVKVSMRAAVRQTASSSRPSMFGGSAARLGWT